MTLVLRGITLNEEPISQPPIGRFDERGGSVGRSDDATLTLPDPERMISRIQAQVLHRDGHYWIENVSAATPILHNGRPLSTGMRVVLREGDELRIGGYALQAAFENDAASATILRGRTVIPALKSAPAVPKAVPAPAPASGDGQWARTPGPPHNPDTSGTLDEPLPAMQPQQRSPQPQQRSPEGQPKEPGGRPVSQESNGASLWRSFLQGAGVELSLPAGPTPELLGAIGEMMQIAVGGIQRLISMRARAKNEMQAEMTMIQVRDNNPLKFSPDAALALQMLLQPPARGFLAGPAALRDALTDLQSHQVGMTAGMRAILEAVLDRLDPAKLETLPMKRSVFDWFRPASRGARLWELYLKQYHSLREETHDNFQRFFGEAFREAYEAQVRSLDAASDPRAPGGPKAGGAAR